MNKIFKGLILLFSAVILFSVLPFSAEASPDKTVSLDFSETEEGKTLVSVILPPPDKLTVIDFSLILSSEGTAIDSLSTENTGIANMIYDFDSLPEHSDENEIFTYTAVTNTDRISFSGFFLDSFTSDDKLHLCDIIIASDRAFTEKDIVRFSCTLTGEESKEAVTLTYSLLNKDLTENNWRHSYPSGDANLDGIIDSSDARLILRASVGLDALGLEASPYADSDCDGKITATDARFALRFSVGLEETQLHSFDISLEEGKTCEEGGKYTFTCALTGISFSMEITGGGHICSKAACLTAGKCVICHEELLPATGHSFNENGICTACSADKALLDEASDMLTSLLGEIRRYDALAYDALQCYKRTDFFRYTQEATKCILMAAEACKGIPELDATYEKLMTAYSIRFGAFISVTDENGKILTSAENCNIVNSAVTNAKQYIDDISFNI